MPIRFSCPCRTPAPNQISKRFEGNSHACKQAGVMMLRSHALGLVSSAAPSKTGNRVIFPTEVDLYICIYVIHDR